MSDSNRNVDQHSEVLLKILSGNHQGAEMVLDGDPLIIGKSSDCDIVISDSMIADKHVKIKVIGKTCVLKPLNGKIFIDGKLVKTETVEVSQFQFITLGDTHLVFGPINETWPAISASDAPKLKDTEFEDQQSNDMQKQNFVEQNEFEQENMNVLEVSQEDISNQQHRTKKRILIKIGTGFSFILSVILILMLSVFNKPKPTEIKLTNKQLVAQIIETNSFENDLKIEEDKTGKLSVSGYVGKNSELSTLKSQLYNIDSTMKIKVYSDEKILSDASVILAQIESSPTIAKVKAGVFVVSGYVYEKAVWEKTRKKIIDEVGGIIDLQDQVILPQKAYSIARPILAKYRLTSKVVLMPQSQAIVLGGVISSDEEENWKLAKIQLDKAFGQDAPLKDFVKISDPEVIKKQYFGSEIHSISISDNGLNWIGFKDGTKYMEGATLSNGYTIQKISPDNIILTKNNQTIVLKTIDL